MSETDPSNVKVILEAKPGVLDKYMEGNKDVEASGHIIGTEKFSNWMS